MTDSIAIIDRGMSCLVKELGAVDAEYFISFVKNDAFDYTAWRKTQFDDMSIKDISRAAAAYEKEHPAVFQEMTSKG